MTPFKFCWKSDYIVCHFPSSEIAQNLECSGIRYSQPITLKFCTRHDSYIVVTCVQNFVVIGRTCCKRALQTVLVYHVLVRICAIFETADRSQYINMDHFRCLHYSDVIINTMASQITSVSIFTQPFVQAQIEENIKAPRHWPLWGEFTGDRRIPSTKGQ